MWLSYTRSMHVATIIYVFLYLCILFYYLRILCISYYYVHEYKLMPWSNYYQTPFCM